MQILARNSSAFLCMIFAACGGVALDDETQLGQSSAELTAWESLADRCGCTSFSGTINKTVRVAAGGNLQAAIDAATSGTEIVLDAGAVYTGNYYLPKKSITSYITIRSSSAL